jgi:hypothetical protein
MHAPGIFPGKNEMEDAGTDEFRPAALIER